MSRRQPRADRGYPRADHHRAFATLTPILPGRAAEVRRRLKAFGKDNAASPLATLEGTHYARWLVISGFHSNSRWQVADEFKSEYLLFTACFDGHDLDAYLAGMQRRMDDAAERIWSQCVGYGGIHDLARYLKHNELGLSLLFVECPKASVKDIKDALALKDKVFDFVSAHRGVRDARALREDWNRTFPQ